MRAWSSRPVPAGARRGLLEKLSKPFASVLARCPATSSRSRARSTRGRAPSGSSGRPTSSRRRTAGRRSRSSTRRTSSARPTASSSRRRTRSRRSTRRSGSTTPTSTRCACGCSRTRSTTTCSSRRTSTATSSPTSRAQMVGGLGFGCSGNIGEKLAVFEPTHGSAPKYAGQYKVNPIATILAAKMMLDWLGETEKGAPRRGRRRGRHRRRQGAHVRHGRHVDDARYGRRRRPSALRAEREIDAPWKILLHEVGLRDGLQVEKTVVPTEHEGRLDRRLAASGVDVVQVGSFVHPEKVPQMADTDELFRRFAAETAARTTPRRAILSGLVLNEKGLERGARLRRRALLHGRFRERDAQPEEHRHGRCRGDGADRRDGEGGPRGGKAGAGRRSSRRSAAATRGRCRRSACSRSAAPTSTPDSHASASPTRPDMRSPSRSASMFRALLAPRPWRSRRPATSTTPTVLGMANVYAALGAGVTSFETSFAGLGGCPFTKVAGGNVAPRTSCTCSSAWGCDGTSTFTPSSAIAQDVAAFFGRAMPGRVHRAGPIPDRAADGGPGDEREASSTASASST